MSLRYQAGCTLALSVLVVLGAALTASGQVPTAADFDACNAEAPKAARAGTASPVEADRARADRARAGPAIASSGDGASNQVQSSDPQIHGMSAEGARDAGYQAAYRSCMRRKGF